MRHGVVAYAGSGPERDRVSAAARRIGLREIGGVAGLALFAGTAIADRRLPDRSILLGDIFPLTGAECRTPGEGWGNYLAVSGRGVAIRIERAPLTGMPLYWLRHGDGILLTSHLQLVEELLCGVTIDWEFVARSLSYINHRTERTGLSGVSELLPGSRLEFAGRDVGITSLWSPWRHVSPSTARSVGELAPELERCLLACVGKWTRTRPDIILELSGGLDSSVVAAALAGSGSGFSAVNFVAPKADGDERFYARAVAAHCGAALVEADLGLEEVHLVAPPTIVRPRPTDYAVLGGIDAAFARTVGERTGAIFGGIGGDNIFGFDGSVAPILDAFDAFGMSRRSFAALRDVARAGEATIWTAWTLARKARRKGPRRSWRREGLFLAPDCVPDTPFAHPWDDGFAGAGPGQRNHVEAVHRILDFVDRPARWHDRDVVAPLLSQPLVELCLSIPSWTWVAGGRDRAVVRAAFARRLPADVVWRRGKGRIESVAAAAYLAQRSDLRDLLIGGRLASRSLLDRDGVEAYLSRDIVPGDFDYYRLLEIADVERWVRSIETAPFFGPSLLQRTY